MNEPVDCGVSHFVTGTSYSVNSWKPPMGTTD